MDKGSSARKEVRRGMYVDPLVLYLGLVQISRPSRGSMIEEEWSIHHEKCIHSKAVE